MNINAIRTAVATERSEGEDLSRYHVRVYTFGGFELVTDQPQISPRARTKPIELLKTLIMFGGRSVAVSRLSEMLWADSDGDHAEHALETTLHRLRKLVGDECIQTRGGQLTINAGYCWVDVWAFEALLKSLGKGMSPMLRAQRLVDLYRGPFLDGDDSPAAVIQRERMHVKFLRAVKDLGRILEARTDYQTAIVCYEKGIGADPLAEELYRCLMHCHRRLGRPAEALAVYRRCEKILMSVLHVEPSAETKSLYREIYAAS
jgi:DNA-binding SARP family transcriptional activator